MPVVKDRGSPANASNSLSSTYPAAEVHVVDPLLDDRWSELVFHHPLASPFHTRAWLRALQLTYAYEPFALTTASPNESLKNGIVLCRVSSRLTGKRTVSLPFSDHCEPLVDSEGEFRVFLQRLSLDRERHGWRYVELRPSAPFRFADPQMQASCSYRFHVLDLRPSLEHIYRNLHSNSIQRKIRRAEREGLSYEVGRSPALLEIFYQLLLITRRRQGVLPQPRSWFRNLVACMAGELQIRVARKGDRPIASILSLTHRRSVTYKYGVSDETFHNLGGVPFLFWKLIEESKNTGMESIDFGRTEIENTGLITFKKRLGTEERALTYYRLPGLPGDRISSAWLLKGARWPISVLPTALSSAAGRLLYRHMG